MAGAPHAPAMPLARYLAAAYVLVVIYASLYPLAHWHDTGVPLTDFLTASWPRYVTNFDIVINVAAYVPLGLLAVPALQPPFAARGAAISAIVLCAALSLGLEIAQHFLPSRVPSNLDLAANTLGAFIGAILGWRYGAAFGVGGGLDRWRARRIVRGRAGELGLTLLALWLLTQLNQEGLLFGNGDLRSMLDLAAPVGYSAERQHAVELLVAATGVLSVGLTAREMQLEPSGRLIGGLFVLAMAIKALTWAVLVAPEAFADWLTAGNRLGLLIGAVALAPALLLPPAGRVAAAALALLATTALVNLAPENPYGYYVVARWNQGHFFNFSGLTRLVSTCWPFMALAFLIGRATSRQG